MYKLVARYNQAMDGTGIGGVYLRSSLRRGRRGSGGGAAVAGQRFIKTRSGSIATGPAAREPPYPGVGYSG